MKSKISILIVCMMLMAGCANTNYYVLGVDVKAMTKENVGMTALGAVATMGAHFAGHYLAAEILDIEITTNITILTAIALNDPDFEFSFSFAANVHFFTIFFSGTLPIA